MTDGARANCGRCQGQMHVIASPASTAIMRQVLADHGYALRESR